MYDLNELSVMSALFNFLVESGETQITNDGISAFISNSAEDFEEELTGIINENLKKTKYFEGV